MIRADGPPHVSLKVKISEKLCKLVGILAKGVMLEKRLSVWIPWSGLVEIKR